jgi:AbrB family looped-hinge helix DNA binding protein
MHIAYVTAKGQLTIPVELRRKYNIKKGTRVNFVEVHGKIVMQPVTREYINSLCGMFKVKPGEKLATQELIEEHAEEVRRDEEKFARHGF